ncbi:MAG: small multidrug efflux protein, partial [Brevibacterium aurantiacum]
RFGVPGASLLGPLAIPTQITSTILVSSGVKTSWILLWQGIAIVVWTTLTTLIATGALSLFTG